MFLFSCAVILIVIYSFQPGKTADAQTRNLFELKEEPRARLEAERSSVASLRESEIDITDFSIKANRARKLRFPLLDGKIYEAALSNFEDRGSNDFTWRGKLAIGKKLHDVILTFKSGHVAGLIYAPGTVYEIVPIGAKHMLVELDQN